MKPSIGRAALLSLLLFRCGSSTPVASPNLVIVTIDTLRADRLGVYGYFRDTTPFLDQLAEESLVFERCFAPMATTFPSHLSLFTGTYPNETGAIANADVGGLAFVSTSRLRTLAEILRDGGYRTAGFVSATPLKKYTGIDAGFEVFDEPERLRRRASETNELVSRWISEQGDQPFFLWVHYFDPHYPYNAPEPFDSRYATQSEQKDYLEGRRFKRSWAAINNRYDGEVSYVDNELGRLVGQLEQRPDVWDRTVVIVAGDHGEGLGQHGEAQHGGVWDEQLHVPFLIRVPGVSPGRIDRLMSVADAVPTLMGLVDLPGEAAFLRQTSGIDRLAKTSPPPTVFSQESSAPWKLGDDRSSPRYMLRDEEWKFVYDPDGENLLFRLSEDPYEFHNVRDRYPDVEARLEKTLFTRMEEQQRRQVELLAERLPDEGKADPEILKQLRSLGYVQ